jgi:hypothetical protein
MTTQMLGHFWQRKSLQAPSNPPQPRIEYISPVASLFKEFLCLGEYRRGPRPVIEECQAIGLLQ